jgi:hypothetical protein
VGTSWSWDVVFSHGSLTAKVVDHALTRADEAGFSVHPPGGAINSFSLADGHREVEYRELVSGLVDRRLNTNLWTPSGVDIGFTTQPSFGVGPPSMTLSIDAGVPRPPAPGAHEFRHLHRQLTDLWIVLLDELGADFGRVDDEWSIERVWRLIPEPVTLAPPPADQWPFPMGWWTFVNAHRFRLLPDLPSWLWAGMQQTPGGGTVIALTDDPTMIDVLEYEELHIRMKTRSSSAGSAG